MCTPTARRSTWQSEKLEQRADCSQCGARVIVGEHCPLQCYMPLLQNALKLSKPRRRELSRATDDLVTNTLLSEYAAQRATRSQPRPANPGHGSRHGAWWRKVGWPCHNMRTSSHFAGAHVATSARQRAKCTSPIAKCKGLQRKSWKIVRGACAIAAYAHHAQCKVCCRRLNLSGFTRGHKCCPHD